MNPAFVWRSALKDLKRKLRDPWELAFWIGLPLILVSLILLAFGGGDRVPKARVLVVDRDASIPSELIAQALERVAVIEVEKVDEAAGRTAIEKGRASALLTIPKGFGGAVLAQTPVTLDLVTNPAQRILPGIVEETLEVLADAVFYAQRLFGEELRALAPDSSGGFRPPTSEVVSAASVRINQRLGRLVPYLNPPAITLDARIESTRTGPALGLGALFFPGVLFMALLFMATGMASDMWVERDSGTLRRVVSTPQRVTDFLAGKVLAGTILMAAVSLLALAVGVVSFGVPAASMLPGTLWAAFSGTVFLVLITLIQLHASSARTAGVFTTMLIFPLLMVGGSFFPFEAMPPGLARIGQMTPNGWALTQLKTILWETAEPRALMLAVLALAAVALAAFAWCARRTRRGFVGA